MLLQKIFLNNENAEIIKAASSKDEFSLRFLKQDAEILAKPISWHINNLVHNILNMINF